MISVESAMVQSDACATELQHTTNTVEKNNKKNMKKPMLPAIDLFPSVFHFNHANQHNMSSLLESMRCIKSNISSNINDCYEKPMKAALLKESIHQALSWILMSYRNLPKDENSSAYLESMSDLLAMYIDMELRASKRGQEQFSAISTRLICCLYTYLDNSTDYMVDTLIKIRHMSHLFHIILDPIMAKILKNIPPLPKSEIVYVRYLLGFRLWKMINSDLVGKKQIRQTAVTLLGTAPTNLPDFLINYYGSGSQTKSTLFLMKHKFDVKACCADFINFCKREAENCSQPDDKMNCHERVQDPEQQVIVLQSCFILL